MYQKQVLFILGLAGVIQLAHAQDIIKAGTIQVSGAVSYQQQNNDNRYNLYDQQSGTYLSTTQHNRSQYFYTTPAVSYFVANNLAVGLSVTSSSEKRAVSYDNTFGQLVNSDVVTSGVNVGIFAQYYKLLNSWFGLTTILGANTGTSQTHTHPYNGNGSDYDGRSYSVNLTPGLVFFPISRFAVGTSIGGLAYNRSRSSASNGNATSSGFGANFGVSYLSFSGTYFFSRRQ